MGFLLKTHQEQNENFEQTRTNSPKKIKKNRSEEEKILDCDEFCDGQVFQLPRFLNKGRTSRESTNLVVERTDDKYYNTDTVKLPIS